MFRLGRNTPLPPNNIYCMDCLRIKATTPVDLVFADDVIKFKDERGGLCIADGAGDRQSLTLSTMY